jgi:hypothetical protein
MMGVGIYWCIQFKAHILFLLWLYFWEETWVTMMSLYTHAFTRQDHFFLEGKHKTGSFIFILCKKVYMEMIIKWWLWKHTREGIIWYDDVLEHTLYSFSGYDIIFFILKRWDDFENINEKCHMNLNFLIYSKIFNGLANTCSKNPC